MDTTLYIIFHIIGDAQPWNPGVPTQKLVWNLKTISKRYEDDNQHHLHTNKRCVVKRGFPNYFAGFARVV